MNAKRYLNQIRVLDRKIRILSDEIAQYEALATRITPVMDKLNVQSSPGNRKEDAMIQFVESTWELSKMMKEYSQRRTEALEAVLKLNRAEHIEILYKRYFELKKWEEIEAEMGYSDRWVFKTHGNALKELTVQLSSVEVQ